VVGGCDASRRARASEAPNATALADDLVEPRLSSQIRAHPHTASSAQHARGGEIEVALVKRRRRSVVTTGPLEPVSLLCAVDGVADVGAGEGQTEQDKLDQEPGPAAALPVPRHAARGLARLGGAGAGGLAGVALVQVLCLDGDDVEVVAQLASLGAEAEVRDGRDLEVGDLEAGRVFVLGLVLQLELQERVGKVGQTGLGGDLGVADAAGLAG
jgi:hypothetical protein